MDVREGGKWTAVMRGPENHVIHWDGEYIEVSEPEKLSFTVSDQPDEDVYDLCTVELTDLAGTRTEMRFTQSGGHMPAEAYRRAAAGLVRLLRADRRATRRRLVRPQRTVLQATSKRQEEANERKDRGYRVHLGRRGHRGSGRI